MNKWWKILWVSKEEKELEQKIALRKDEDRIANNVVDRVGAGDSMLSIISLLVKIGAPHDLSLLLGSFAGAASVESIGNSTFLKKKNFLRHLEFALK